MKTFFMILELLIAICIIGMVLLLPPKGEGMGAIGGQAKLFNASRSVNSGMDRVLIGLSAAFLLIGMILGILR